MAKCAGCSGGGGCHFGVTDTGSLNLTLVGDGSIATPWNISGVASGSGTADHFGLNINGTDTDLNTSMAAGTVGYTDTDGFGGFFGGETVNLNPLRLDPGDSLIFDIEALLVTVTYSTLVQIYVTSLDCTEKIKLQRAITVTPADSGNSINLGTCGSWSISTSGTDLTCGSSAGSMLVTSASGICVISELLLFWSAV